MEVFVLGLFLLAVISFWSGVILHKLREIKDMLEAEG